MLVILLPGVIRSQEKNNSSNPLKPTIVHQSDGVKKKAVSNQKESDEVSIQEKRIKLIDKQIAELEKLKIGDSKISEVELLSIETTNFKTKNSQSLDKEVGDYLDLQLERKMLMKRYIELIDESSVENDSQKREKLFETASSVIAAYEEKQKEMSNIIGRMNYIKFEDNKVTIDLLLSNYNGELMYKKLVQKLCNEADFAMRMALEIREETSFELSNAAILGNYSNAEEKEIVALTKQNKAIEILEKTAAILFSNWSEGLAYAD